MKQYKLLDLTTSIDVLNTINGGTSEPKIHQRLREDAREVLVQIPGIPKESIQVEVHNNRLTIFYFIPLESNGMTIQMPLFVYNKLIPYYIDIDKIKSAVEDDELVVRLPFNSLANGYHRVITLDENE